MANLNRRLERLEAAWPDAGCPACSGPGVTFVMDSDGPPRPCPACGVVPESIRFTITFDRPDDIDDEKEDM